MRTLFSYYGGKQRMASKIVELINQIPHTVYCEPFCGGSAVLFAKDVVIPNNSDNYREIINDHNQELINLYRVFQSRYDEFCHLINFTPFSEEEHRKSKQISKNPQDYDELWRAWSFYVNISMSFSKTMNRGWARGTLGNNHPVTWNNKKTELPEIFKRLSNVYISCCDALKCIKDFDSPTSLFYIDPPYPNAHQGHYAGYSQQDFEKLVDLLKEIQGSFILSNYYNDYVPKDWRLVEVEAVMCASPTKREKRIECLWIVDRSKGINELPLFQLA